MCLALFFGDDAQDITHSKPLDYAVDDIVFYQPEVLAVSLLPFFDARARVNHCSATVTLDLIPIQLKHLQAESSLSFPQCEALSAIFRFE